MSNKFKPVYSGSASIQFWKIINALPEERRNVAYLLGVLLQDLEYKALQSINNLIRGEPV